MRANRLVTSPLGFHELDSLEFVIRSGWQFSDNVASLKLWVIRIAVHVQRDT